MTPDRNAHVVPYTERKTVDQSPRTATLGNLTVVLKTNCFDVCWFWVRNTNLSEYRCSQFFFCCTQAEFNPTTSSPCCGATLFQVIALLVWWHCRCCSIHSTRHRKLSTRRNPVLPILLDGCSRCKLASDFFDAEKSSNCHSWFACVIATVLRHLYVSWSWGVDSNHMLIGAHREMYPFW